MAKRVEASDRLLAEVTAFRERDRAGIAAKFLGQCLLGDIARRGKHRLDPRRLEGGRIGLGHTAGTELACDRVDRGTATADPKPVGPLTAHPHDPHVVSGER